MLLETYNQPWDFELLDTGDGFRLERWGDCLLIRPDPQIIWQKSLPKNEWDKAWAIYKTLANNNRGQWEIKKTLPAPWIIKFKNTAFLLKLSPFKHTGLFAEQAANWDFMIKKLNDSELKNRKIPNPKILNLFAYTGGATMVLAKAGCQITHVDASKPSINWANENHKLNNLPANSVRWILDDALKFVKREVKRGAKYEGIIMDPPAFGHSPEGKIWKFNKDLPGLLLDCAKLLSSNAQFLLVNGYATNSSALSLNNLLFETMKNFEGQIEFGELCLKQSSKRLISTGIFARWHT